MPKPAIRVAFVPSRLALITHLGLAASVALTLGHWLSGGLGGVVLGGLATLAWFETRSVPPALHYEGQWHALLAGRWQPVDLQVTRLGPWLVGLKIAGRHYWLWPDSAPKAALQKLRRTLLHGASDSTSALPKG